MPSTNRQKTGNSNAAPAARDPGPAQSRIEMSADGILLAVGESVAQLLGFEGNELVGNNLASFVHPEDYDDWSSVIAAVFAEGVSASVAVRARHADGRWIALELTGGIQRANEADVRAVFDVRGGTLDSEPSAGLLRVAGLYTGAALATAAATGALTNLIYVLFTSFFSPVFPLGFFVGHLVYVLALQVVLGLLLGFFAEGRALAAATLLLPVCLVAAPMVHGAFGLGALGLLAGSALAFFALASHWPHGPGAPILAGAIGCALALALVALRGSDPGAASVGPGIVAALFAIAALKILFVPGHRLAAVSLPTVRGSLTLALVAVFLGAISLWPRQEARLEIGSISSAGSRQPPVVLIVLDTVRADHLAIYGYHRDTMPKLESFARREAVVVHNAIANGSWSLPSHASLFTGLHPPRHGAHAARLEDSNPPPIGVYPLSEQVPTLAEVLGDAGYLTIGISANYGYLSDAFGLPRGFAHYRAERNPASVLRGLSPWRIPRLPYSPAGGIAAALDRLPPFSSSEFFLGVGYERAERITDRAIRALEGIGEEPFFLFLNYMDAHDPYYPPYPFRSRFEGVQPALGQHGVDWNRIREVIRGDRTLRPDETEHLTALYDAELAYLDLEVDRLLRYLSGREGWSEFVVVITSDHGEALGEHGDVVHGISLFDENVRVPLIIKPGRHPEAPPPGSELTGPMESVDVFATILEHAGVDAPKEIDGLPWGRGRSQARSWLYGMKPSGVAAERFERELRSVTVGEWKLVASTTGETQLFHLPTDSGETKNLAAAEAKRRLELEALLGDEGAPIVTTRPPEAAGDATERLRALGYVE